MEYQIRPIPREHPPAHPDDPLQGGDLEIGALTSGLPEELQRQGAQQRANERARNPELRKKQLFETLRAHLSSLLRANRNPSLISEEKTAILQTVREYIAQQEGLPSDRDPGQFLHILEQSLDTMGKSEDEDPEVVDHLLAYIHEQLFSTKETQVRQDKAGAKPKVPKKARLLSSDEVLRQQLDTLRTVDTEFHSWHEGDPDITRLTREGYAHALFNNYLDPFIEGKVSLQDMYTIVFNSKLKGHIDESPQMHYLLKKIFLPRLQSLAECGPLPGNELEKNAWEKRQTQIDALLAVFKQFAHNPDRVIQEENEHGTLSDDDLEFYHSLRHGISTDPSNKITQSFEKTEEIPKVELQNRATIETVVPNILDRVAKKQIPVSSGLRTLERIIANGKNNPTILYYIEKSFSPRLELLAEGKIPKEGLLDDIVFFAELFEMQHEEGTEIFEMEKPLHTLVSEYEHGHTDIALIKKKVASMFHDLGDLSVGPERVNALLRVANTRIDAYHDQHMAVNGEYVGGISREEMEKSIVDLFSRLREEVKEKRTVQQADEPPFMEELRAQLRELIAKQQGVQTNDQRGQRTTDKIPGLPLQSDTAYVGQAVDSGEYRNQSGDDSYFGPAGDASPAQVRAAQRRLTAEDALAETGQMDRQSGKVLPFPDAHARDEENGTDEDPFLLTPRMRKG